MNDYDRLTMALAPYMEAMGDIDFASQMAGFEYGELRRFTHDATRDIAKTAVRMKPDKLHQLLSGMLAIGVLLGMQYDRQAAT